MPYFAFEAISASGVLVRGSLEARNSSAALEELIATGQTPVAVHPLSDRPGVAARIAGALHWHKFDSRLFLFELGILLKAGLPVERALNVLSGIAPDMRQAYFVRQMLDRVRAGAPLSQAFATIARDAPQYLSRLLAAGEASGRLPDVVARLAQALTRAKLLRDRVISALTYPCVLVLAMAGVLWIVFGTVLPRLVPMFEDAGGALPTATAALLAIDLFLSSYGWLLAAVLSASIVAFGLALRDTRSRIAIDRFLLDSKLALGLPARYEAVRFCRNLQTLLEGGLSLEGALALTRAGTSNLWLSSRLAGVQAAVAEGETLRAALARAAVLPPLVVEFASVGEETGRLAAMMGEVAQVLDHDLETRLDRLSSLVMPVATLVLGGLVAGIMAGVVSGILAVNDLAR